MNFFKQLDNCGYAYDAAEKSALLGCLKWTKDARLLNEAVESMIELRHLHKEMDETVLKAYGWTDIALAHDFYEVDYLPENDRTRYTISSEARREILKRLLMLNHEIYEREQNECKPLKNKRNQKSGAPKQIKMF